MLVLAIFIVQMSAFMDISDARNANVFFSFLFSVCFIVHVIVVVDAGLQCAPRVIASLDPPPQTAVPIDLLEQAHRIVVSCCHQAIN